MPLNRLRRGERENHQGYDEAQKPDDDGRLAVHSSVGHERPPVRFAARREWRGITASSKCALDQAANGGPTRPSDVVGEAETGLQDKMMPAVTAPGDPSGIHSVASCPGD